MSEVASVTPDVSAGTLPAPAAPPVPAQSRLDSMSSEQRRSWELTGTWPGSDVSAESSPAQTDTPESSPATPVDRAASTDAKTAPASEAGKPVKEKGAKARNVELDADIQALNEKLRIRKALREELAQTERVEPRRPDAPRTSSPAPAQADHERYLAMPDAPREENFDSYAKYSAALSTFITDQRWQEHQQRSHQQTQIQRHVEGVRQMGEQAAARVQKAITADPDFATKVDDRLLAIEPASVRRLAGQPVGPMHVLAEEIAASDRIDQLLTHFSTEEGRHDWRRLCDLSPAALLREFGRLEARLESPAAPSAPQTKTLSTAPKPAATLGARPSEPIDPEVAALKRKDFSAYAAAKNAKDLAAAGGR